MLGVECLSNISSLFASDVRVRASLATRLLQFLELLVRDDELRVALRTHFDFLASLSTFLQRHDAAGTPLSKDESTIRCVTLLQRITFGLDTRDESHRHLEFLVGLLVTVLLNDGGSGGDTSPSASTPTDALLLPSLALLVNLSKNNPFVQSLLRNHINIKAFYKRLIACLSRKDDTAVVICAKSVFANLYLSVNGGGSTLTPSSDVGSNNNNNEARLAEKLFSQSNIRQTFQLVLNCMQKASSSSSSGSSSSDSSSSSSLFAQSYGVDLLHTLLRVPAYANCFLSYDHRDAFCRGFFDLLVHVHSRRKALKEVGFSILTKFLQLICLLCEFDELKSTLAAAAYGASTSTSTSSVDSGASITPPFFTTLVSILEAGPKLMTRSSLTTAVAAVQVLERMRAINSSSTSTATLFTEKVIPACGRVLGLLSEQRPLDGVSTQSSLSPSISAHASNAGAAATTATSSAASSSKAEAPVESLLILAASVYRLLASVIHFRDAVRSFKSALDIDVPVVTVETLLRHRPSGGDVVGVRSEPASWQDASFAVVIQALKFLTMAHKIKGKQLI